MSRDFFSLVNQLRPSLPGNAGNQVQIAYIPEETEPLVGLGVVHRELVRELGRRCREQRIATVDRDATIIESRKQGCRTVH